MVGGNYGHNGGRQQRKRPRDFDDDQYRRPRSFDILEKLKRDLVNLADPGNVGPIEDIKYVARRIAIDFETPENQKKILELIRECLLQLSVKTCHYAAVVSLAGAQNKEFGSSFISMIAESLSQALGSRQWRDVKLFLRLLALLDRCLNTSSTTTITILLEMTNTVVQAQFDHRTEFGERICESVMLTLPYLASGSGLSGLVAEENIGTIMGRIEHYMHVRGLSSERIKSDSLALLYEQCKQSVESGWNVNYLPQFLDKIESDIPIASLDMPPVQIASVSKEDGTTSTRTCYQVFPQQAVKSVPSSREVSFSVFRDLVSDVLDLLVTNRKDAARFLIDLESYMTPNIFVLRGTPLDKIPESGPTWKAEDIVVEAIFSELFAMPAPPHKPVYYHSVLTELCKLVPQAIAPTFGRTIRAIYQNFENIEPELVYRFWDWFSHHLSNFGFNWKWQEWIEDLNLNPLHPKSVFIRESIQKEAELSYNQRIKTTLPIEYHDLIPDEAPGPDFRYNKPEVPFHQEVIQLTNGLATGADAEKLQGLLDVLEQKIVAQGLDAEQETLIILVQAVLQLGHQSFSHALNTIEGNLPLLQLKCDASPRTRRVTVSAVMSFWSGRPFIASTLLQKLLNYRIVSPISILEYILQDTSDSAVTSSITWELIKTTIEKVNLRVLQVQNRLSKMNVDGAASIVSTSKDDKEDGLAAAAASPGLPLASVEPIIAEGEGGLDQLERLQRTWADVQREQKEVFTFVVDHFLGRLEALSSVASAAGGGMEDAKWLLYWTRGQLDAVLRRNRVHIVALREDVRHTAQLEEALRRTAS